MFGTKFSRKENHIFGVCSSEDLEGLEWKKGIFYLFLGQHSTAEFSLAFFLASEKPKH